MRASQAIREAREAGRDLGAAVVAAIGELPISTAREEELLRSIRQLLRNTAPGRQLANLTPKTIRAAVYDGVNHQLVGRLIRMDPLDDEPVDLTKPVKLDEDGPETPCPATLASGEVCGNAVPSWAPTVYCGDHETGRPARLTAADAQLIRNS